MRKVITVLLLVILGFSSQAQDPFNLVYNFRLFNEKGQVITRDSLVKNTLFILPNPGRILASDYNDTTHFFHVVIRTTMPIFRIAWNHNNELMEFTVDHRTAGNAIWLDSLAFNPGQYCIGDDDEHSWWKGLNIQIKKDGKNLHIVKFNFADFKTREKIMNDKKLKKVKVE